MVNLNWQKYPVYKSSGVEWLGDIPEHWEVKRLKFYFQSGKLGIKIGPFGSYIKSDIIKSSNEIKSTERYKVYGQENVIGNSFKKGDKYINVENFNRLSAYQIYPGNLVITMMGTTGRCMVVPLEIEPGIMDSHLIRISVNENEIKPTFLALLINDSFYIYAQVKINSKGSIMEGLNSSIIKYLLIAKPPLSEQQAIANFLDDKLAQIDEHIAKKQRMIELLKEQKPVIINQAVTKGINPDVPMKYSGVEWLGEIPEHWEVKRLKYVSHIQTGVTLGKSYINQVLETRPYLRVANVQDGYIDISDIKTIELPNNEISRYVLQKGDVLMTEGGDFDKLGRGYIWKGQIKGCLHQNHIFAVRPIYKYLNSNFIAAFISSKKCKNYFIFTAKQTTNLASTNSTHLKNLKLLLPPLNEQQEIVSFIEKKSEKIGRSLTVIEKEIKLIQEYRTTLISETVTGKIDVRKYHPPQ